MLKDSGFLGTDATFGADLTLIAYILILLPLMFIGYQYARRKKFDNHKLVMTAITAFNWVLIGLVMSVSYREQVGPVLGDELSEPYFVSPGIHALFGFGSQLLATYLVIRMWFEKQLPSFMLVKNFKLWMRLTLILWIISAVLGIVTYYVWYVDTPDETATTIDAGDLAGVEMITMSGSAFQPAAITVEVGTTIIWTNEESRPHTVTFDDGSVDSGRLDQGDTFEYTFTEAGEFPIYCDFHGGPGGEGMSMVVTVSGGEAAAEATEEATEEAVEPTEVPTEAPEATEEASADVQRIEINGSSFDPGNLTVEVGTTVIWTNNASRPHTVTFDDGSVDSGRMAQGDTFEYTFTEAGEFPIYCDFHGGPGGQGMSMVVTVSGGEAEDAQTSGEMSEAVAVTMSESAAVQQIEINGSSFDPGNLTVEVGTTVIWTNNASRPHTVTFDDGSVDSGRMAQGDTFEYTFTEAGEFPIYCDFHGGPGGQGMSMVVTVSGGEAEEAEMAEAEDATGETGKSTTIEFIDIKSSNFEPGIITVKVGTVVIWLNSTSRPHTITFDDGSVDSGRLDQGETFQHAFTEAGEFPLYCDFHGGPGGEGMSMVVKVE